MAPGASGESLKEDPQDTFKAGINPAALSIIFKCILPPLHTRDPGSDLAVRIRL